MKPIRISQDERDTLRAVEGGADVFSRIWASALRAVVARYPALVDVDKPAGEYGPHAQHPYLGAVLTDLGRALVSKRKIRKGARCETSGRGRTSAWKHQQGTVTSRIGDMVYVIWDGCTFEDQLFDDEIQGVITLPATEAP